MLFPSYSSLADHPAGLARVFRSNIAGESVPGVDAANVSFLIKKDAKDKFVSVATRDYPDTVFQDDVSKVVGGLKTFWSERGV